MVKKHKLLYDIGRENNRLRQEIVKMGGGENVLVETHVVEQAGEELEFLETNVED